MSIKRFFAAAAAILIAGVSFARTQIGADDAKVNYVGRVLKADGAVSFDWSGVCVKVAFTGKSLSMDIEDSHANWFNVWIDEPYGVRATKVIRTEGIGTIEIASGLKKGQHKVLLQKRTEGEQGRVTIRSFVTDGTFGSAAANSERLIEFIGDSYTCGYGTEAPDRDDPFKAETENCNLTYAAIAGRYFNADVRMVSHSGRGVVRNYDGYEGSTINDCYTRTFDESPEPAWIPDGRVPDIVVIYLGTNDFSCGVQPSLSVWTEGYLALIGKVRGFYGPDVPVLAVASMADPLLAEYVRGAAISCGDPNVAWTAINPKAHNTEDELGASWHPNYKGHRKVASCMVPYISTLTGWEMPFSVLE